MAKRAGSLIGGPGRGLLGIVGLPYADVTVDLRPTQGSATLTRIISRSSAALIAGEPSVAKGSPTTGGPATTAATLASGPTAAVRDSGSTSVGQASTVTYADGTAFEPASEADVPAVGQVPPTRVPRRTSSTRSVAYLLRAVADLTASALAKGPEALTPVTAPVVSRRGLAPAHSDVRGFARTRFNSIGANYTRNLTR